MVRATNIYKSFHIGSQNLPILKDVSLHINHGEFVSLMGASGSGKSTLLYILGGLDHADSGNIKIAGKEIATQNDSAESMMRRNDIGFVFQAYNLIENLTVEENILLPALLSGKKRKDLKIRLDELLQAVGMQKHRKHRPMELSGGQQQRTAIARALINYPKVIFADEPIGNLDSKNGKEVLELFCRLNLKYQITILMVTHSEASATYSNRIIRLEDGQIIS